MKFELEQEVTLAAGQKGSLVFEVPRSGGDLLLAKVDVKAGALDVLAQWRASADGCYLQPEPVPLRSESSEHLAPLWRHLVRRGTSLVLELENGLAVQRHVCVKIEGELVGLRGGP